jgi:hypothetical protein
MDDEVWRILTGLLVVAVIAEGALLVATMRQVRNLLLTVQPGTPLHIGGGPWVANPSSSAAHRYFFTVSRATPLARAIARCDSPICQRRTTSTISMRLSSRYPIPLTSWWRTW